MNWVLKDGLVSVAYKLPLSCMKHALTSWPFPLFSFTLSALLTEGSWQELDLVTSNGSFKDGNADPTFSYQPERLCCPLPPALSIKLPLWLVRQKDAM